MDKENKEYEELAELFKALSHPVRLCIVRGLMEKGECNVGHMQSCLDTPQSTLSQYLQKLRAAGIVECHRKGLEVYYRVCDPRVIKLVQALFPVPTVAK